MCHRIAHGLPVNVAILRLEWLAEGVVALPEPGASSGSVDNHLRRREWQR